MDSESDDYNLNNVSGSESDDYVPVKKTATKATKAKAAPKPKSTANASKGKAPAKKKAAAKPADSDEDEDSGMDTDEPTSTARRQEEPDEPVGQNKKKSTSEMYQKLTQLEHILKRPDSYIGSIETITTPMWTYDSETRRMVHREVKYVPGFFKIVDEILVNAADNKINDPSMDTLKVTIDVEEGTISVYNNGRGIPIEIHSKEKMYIPEMIFGHLLTSTNYDDDEKKLTGGRNGYGAKLANIYSLEFTVETADKNTSQKYKQTWTDNMSKCGKAKITKNTRGEEYTRITFRPDLKRFGMNSIDEDTVSLLKRRVFDMAGTVKDVKVFLNDERLKIKNFKQYVEMYVSSVQEAAAEKSGGAAQPKQTVIHEQISDRWEIAYTLSTEGTFQHVSFANSIATSKGGTHVNYIADQISKALVTSISKKNKGATVKPAQIRNHMWLFVKSLIVNPTFDSQTKELLTLPSSKFGSKPTISDEFIKKVAKSGIVDNVLNWAKFKADQQMKRADGTKRSRLLGLAKLSDANNAGTRHAQDCTLILTEGDSAKALAIAGLGVVGRDNFGVFPLRGKLLNVREARHDQIMKNEEIQNIKKIMGLQHNKDYTNTSSLRYGRLMIMTDQDHDGSHIKGLIINFLDHFYPSLLKIPDFLVEFVTPIVRVKKGNKVKDFFTIPEYEQWLEETPDARKWESKYYKGLGTSEDKDAREYFSKMEKHMIPFAPTQEGDRELIDLAFSKKKADERKEWLRQFKPGTFLDHRLEEIPYSEFINKELILFSMADNVRSIPSIADGLKPGQRKVIWGCFKRKLKKEIKVAQLVGYISEHAAYHHGEASLAATIINLAQDYVGSNNLALLSPNGQYGTREIGGKDHAAPRYIFTNAKSITRAIYHPFDDPLLNYLKDDDVPIEPEWYMPTVPMVLINGAEGIGTGWSTNIPPYNPVDIVANLRRMMKEEEPEPMTPWWRGFKGEVRPTGKGKYDVVGVATKINDTTVEISELPIHKWTRTFKDELEAMITGEKKDKDKDKDKDEDGKKDVVKNAGMVKDFKEHHDNLNVLFEVTMNPKDLEKAEEKGLVEFFGLTTKVSTTNMILFDFEGKIKKYETPEEILKDFYPMRLAYYQKRKDYQALELSTAYDKLNNQIRFIEMIIKKELVVSNRKKADIVAELRKLNFRPFPKVAKTKTAKPDEEEEESEDEEEESGSEAVTDFDYLLGMAIYSLTRERIEKLKQQAHEKEQELLALLEKSPTDLWNTDLDKFLEEWEKDCMIFEQKKGEGGAVNGKKRKQRTLKTRKSIGMGRRGKDSDDDDFVPIKPNAAAKRKPAEPKRPVASSSTKKEDDDMAIDKKPPAPRRAAARKPVLDDSDSDDDDDGGEYGELVVKPAPKGKGKAPDKDVVEIDDDSDPPKPPPRKPASKQAAAGAKRAATKKLSMDDDDDDSDPAPSTKRKPTSKKAKVEDSGSDIEVVPTKGKGKAVGKRKSPAISDSDDDDDKKPAVKKKIDDFFGKPKATAKISKNMKPASPPKKKVLKKLSESSDEEDYVPAPRAASSRPARAARGATKQYVEIVSDEEGEGDSSMFVDDE
ncbi:DNA topoisomerase II [Coprinopsis cinerea AmutBmut pab1-1]|nr:DNA topoisomerase II [Coprinopsis cinerea AmutBmut pab1-1]